MFSKDGEMKRGQSGLPRVAACRAMSVRTERFTAERLAAPPIAFIMHEINITSALFLSHGHFNSTFSYYVRQIDYFAYLIKIKSFDRKTF